MVKLMRGVLRMYDRATSRGSHNVISSQESACGHTLCDKQGGQTTGKSGLEVSHVSRSAQQDKVKDLQIPVTCGRFGWS